MDHLPVAVALDRPQTGLDVGEGGLERLLELVRVAPVERVGLVPVALEDGDLVEQLAAAQAVLDEVEVGPDPVDHRVKAGARGRISSRERAAVGDEVVVDQRVIADQAAQRRLEPVGADQRRAPVAGPVRAGDLDPCRPGIRS
jgi:hypothetical protein